MMASTALIILSQMIERLADNGLVVMWKEKTIAQFTAEVPKF
jgi:hypothetical protein